MMDTFLDKFAISLVSNKKKGIHHMIDRVHNKMDGVHYTGSKNRKVKNYRAIMQLENAF